MASEMDSSDIEISPPSWDQLKAWALEDTDESWAQIDAVIESIANDEEYVLLAVDNLGHGNQNIRDLSASILEASSLELAEDAIKSLKEMLDDEHFYAKFRAACTLAKHRVYSDRREDVKVILQQALTDEDEGVVEIAQQYLAQLEQEQSSN